MSAASNSGAGALKEIQILPEGNPNVSEGNPSPCGRKSKLIPSIFFAGSSLFKDLRRPQGIFILSRSGFGRRDDVNGVRLGFIVGPSAFVSSFSGLLKQEKGWRHVGRGWRP
jgi:hypothetical protein